MTQNVVHLWQQYTDWLRENNPTEFAKLNQPATNDDFTTFRAATGYEFPDDLRQIYRINNGASSVDVRYGAGNFNFAFSHKFLPLNEIIDLWNSLSTADNESLVGSSFPAGAVKTMYTNQRWIPILDDSGGNNIAVDLDPDVNGTVGQVINFGRDEMSKFVIAPSFEDFLKLILRQIEQGNVEVITEDDGVTHWHLRGSRHLTDGLRQLVVPQTSCGTTVANKQSSFIGRLIAKLKG